MNRSHLPVQHDLFGNAPSPPGLASVALHHDELVALLSQLLWDVACNMTKTLPRESRNVEDQR